MASSLSGNDHIGRTHGAASVSSSDIPTLGAVIKVYRIQAHNGIQLISSPCGWGLKTYATSLDFELVIVQSYSPIISQQL